MGSPEHATPVAFVDLSASLKTKTVTSGHGCLVAVFGGTAFPVTSIVPGCDPSAYIDVETTAA